MRFELYTQNNSRSSPEQRLFLSELPEFEFHSRQLPVQLFRQHRKQAHARRLRREDQSINTWKRKFHTRIRI
jgi:hypothetical protein